MSQLQNQWTGKVHCSRVSRLKDPGNIKAFAVVTIGNVSDPSLEIRSVKVIQKLGEEPWVGLPSEQRGSKWFAIVKASDELKAEIERVVLAAWRDSVAFRVGE